VVDYTGKIQESWLDLTVCSHINHRRLAERYDLVR